MNAPVVWPHEALQAEHLRIQGDGVELAAYRWGKTDGPTLLLVHGYPGIDREASVAQAQAVFGGSVEWAREGRTITA